jgi:hypothetical protein
MMWYFMGSRYKSFIPEFSKLNCPTRKTRKLWHKFYVDLPMLYHWHQSSVLWHQTTDEIYLLYLYDVYHYTVDHCLKTNEGILNSLSEHSQGLRDFNIFQLYFTIYRWYVFLKSEHLSWISYATLFEIRRYQLPF